MGCNFPPNPSGIIGSEDFLNCALGVAIRSKFESIQVRGLMSAHSRIVGTGPSQLKKSRMDQDWRAGQRGSSAEPELQSCTRGAQGNR